MSTSSPGPSSRLNDDMDDISLPPPQSCLYRSEHVTLFRMNFRLVYMFTVRSAAMRMSTKSTCVMARNSPNTLMMLQ